MGVTPYTGPAGVVLTPEEWLIVWADLTRIPTGENGEIRRKIRHYLDVRESNGQ